MPLRGASASAMRRSVEVLPEPAPAVMTRFSPVRAAVTAAVCSGVGSKLMQAWYRLVLELSSGVAGVYQDAVVQVPAERHAARDERVRDDAAADVEPAPVNLGTLAVHFDACRMRLTGDGDS